MGMKEHGKKSDFFFLLFLYIFIISFISIISILISIISIWYGLLNQGKKYDLLLLVFLVE